MNIINSQSFIMKKSLFALLFQSFCLLTLAQPADPPNFFGTMSRTVLNQYLERSAFMDDMAEGCYYGYYNPSCYNADSDVLSEIRPFYIARAATSWDGWDWADFSEELNIRKKVDLIDDEIILEGYLSEFITKQLSQNGSLKIIIPDSIESKFMLDTTPVRYFEQYEMRYDDVNNSTTCPNNHLWCDGNVITGYRPDITKKMTQMWYYYIATELIKKGYESFVFGQWFYLNDSDTNNEKFWELLTKIREYGSLNARRHLVLINGTGIWDAPYGSDAVTNNLPYRGYIVGSNSNQLLFDFHSDPATWTEDGYVSNSKSPFYRSANDPRYERLIKAPTSIELQNLYQFGGATAQLSGWSASERASIPFIMHMDVGGGGSKDTEGRLEFVNNGTYPPPPADNQSFLTWGWGGECNYFPYTTLPYRRHLIHAIAHQMRERNASAYFTQTLLAPTGSFYYKFKDIGYNIPPYNYGYDYDWNGSNAINFKISAKNNTNVCGIQWGLSCYEPHVGLKTQNQIKEVWDKTYEISFCSPTTYTSDFTEAQGFNSPNFPRFLMDIDNDGDKDIVGIGQNTTKVSKITGTSFGASTTWGTSDLTGSNGWDYTKHFRSFGKFDSGGTFDLIGFGPSGVTVGRSNGSSAFTFSIWSTDFGNNLATDEWANGNSVRLVANVNNDGFDDIVGFGNGGVYYALSNGTNAFGPKTLWKSDFGNNGGYSNSKHIRTVADIDGDGDSDVIAFGEGSIFAYENINGVLGTLKTLLNDFCFSSGWSVTDHYRTLADIDGDGDLDIIAFGQEGVFVAKNVNWVFDPTKVEYWIYQFGTSARAGSWTSNNHTRLMTDVNGDKLADIVAFGENGLDVVLTAKDQSDQTQGYFTHIFHYNNFGNTSQGWSNFKNVRTATNVLADVGGQQLGPRSEIVCFGANTVYLINSCGNIFADDGFDDRNSTETPESEVLVNGTSIIQLFPNPARSEINLKFTSLNGNELIDQITILNQTGNIVSQQSFEPLPEGFLKVSLLNLTSGMYAVVFKSKSAIITTKRFVKLD